MLRRRTYLAQLPARLEHFVRWRLTGRCMHRFVWPSERSLRRCLARRKMRWALRIHNKRARFLAAYGLNRHGRLTRPLE